MFRKVPIIVHKFHYYGFFRKTQLLPINIMDAEIKIQDGKSDMIKVFKTKDRLVEIINEGYSRQFRQNLDRRSTSFILPKYDIKRSGSFMNKISKMSKAFCLSGLGLRPEPVKRNFF